jgi:hypothetical protein
MEGKGKRGIGRTAPILIIIAAAIAVAAAIAIAVSLAGRTASLRLVVPFKDGAYLEALGAEIKEFESKERRVSIAIASDDYAGIDRLTASGSGGWDLAIGSARLADGRASVERPAIPLFGSPWMLYYNKEVLARAGIVPSEGAEGIGGRLAAGSASLEDFRRACAAVAKARATPIALGSLYGWPLAVWIEALMAADGSVAEAGRLIEADYDLGSPALAKAVAEFKSLAVAGYVDAAYGTKDWPSSLRDLVAGKAGFCLMDDELAAYLPRSERARIGRLPIPGSAAPGGGGWAIGAISYLVRRAGLEGSERRGAQALELWLSSEGASGRLSRRTGAAFFAGGKGPYVAIPSVSSAPSSAVVAHIKAAAAVR